MSTHRDWQAAASKIGGDLQTELSAGRRVLESGINIDPRLLIFDFFPGATALFRTP